jgi:hypothetical protein
VLTDEATRFFDGLTIGRSPDAPMFVRSNGSPWGPTNQTRPMRLACQTAGIGDINFHALRHSWASLAVMAGLPLMLVARNLGHSTTKMVERHYGHLSETYIDTEIKRAGPRFGIETPAGSMVASPPVEREASRAVPSQSDHSAQRAIDPVASIKPTIHTHERAGSAAEGPCLDAMMDGRNGTRDHGSEQHREGRAHRRPSGELFASETGDRRVRERR